MVLKLKLLLLNDMGWTYPLGIRAAVYHYEATDEAIATDTLECLDIEPEPKDDDVDWLDHMVDLINDNQPDTTAQTTDTIIIDEECISDSPVTVCLCGQPLIDLDGKPTCLNLLCGVNELPKGMTARDLFKWMCANDLKQSS